MIVCILPGGKNYRYSTKDLQVLFENLQVLYMHDIYIEYLLCRTIQSDCSICYNYIYTIINSHPAQLAKFLDQFLHTYSLYILCIGQYNYHRKLSNWTPSIKDSLWNLSKAGQPQLFVCFLSKVKRIIFVLSLSYKFGLN